MNDTYRVEYVTELGILGRYIEACSRKEALNKVKQLNNNRPYKYLSTKKVNNGLTMYELCKLEGTL